MNALFWILLVVVLIALFGSAVFTAAYFVFWYALVGLVIGGLARLLVSGTGGLGAFATILAGIAGSIAGGWIAHAFDLGWILQFVIAILAAAIVVAISSSGRD